MCVFNLIKTALKTLYSVPFAPFSPSLPIYFQISHLLVNPIFDTIRILLAFPLLVWASNTILSPMLGIVEVDHSIHIILGENGKYYDYITKQQGNCLLYFPREIPTKPHQIDDHLMNFSKLSLSNGSIYFWFNFIIIDLERVSFPQCVGGQWGNLLWGLRK